MIKTLLKFWQSVFGSGNQRGYTLVEFAITTSIAAMLAVGGLALLHKKSVSDKEKVTKENIKTIKEAIAGFVRVNEYVPCPALPRLLESDTNFGKSSGMTISGSVTVATIYDNDGDDDVTEDTCGNNGLTNGTGMVPVRTLGLDHSYAYDGWGRKFTYRTADASGAKDDFTRVSFKGNLSVIDLTGNEKTHLNDESHQGAVYVIVSHGANGSEGNAAWRKNFDYTGQSSQEPDPSNITGVESYNVDQTDVIFVQDQITSEFDDIVSFGMLKDVVRPKVYEAPFAIHEETCNNAGELAKLQKLNTFSTVSSGTYNSLSKHIYRAAEMVQYICENPPPPILSEAGTAGIPQHALALWLDANDIDGDGDSMDNPADGTDVTTWVDKSGSGRNATAGTAPDFESDGANQMNGKPVVQFNDVNEILNVDYTFLVGSNYTIYTVHNRNKAASEYILNTASVDETDKLFRFGYTNDTSYEFDQRNNSLTVAIPAYSGPVTTMAMGRFSSSVGHSLKIIENGTEYTASNGNTQPILEANSGNIGMTYWGNYYSGSLAELIMYNRALSPVEQKAVECYLGAKWWATNPVNGCS